MPAIGGLNGRKTAGPGLGAKSSSATDSSVVDMSLLVFIRLWAYESIFQAK